MNITIQTTELKVPNVQSDYILACNTGHAASQIYDGYQNIYKEIYPSKTKLYTPIKCV